MSMEYAMLDPTFNVNTGESPFYLIHPLDHPPFPPTHLIPPPSHPPSAPHVQNTSSFNDRANFSAASPTLGCYHSIISPSPPRQYSLGSDHMMSLPPQPSQSLPTTPIQYHHSPFRSPIITSTRNHSIKRSGKRPSTYSRWTMEEDELLRQAVALHGPHKWSLIASHVPNRTPMQCSTRWLGALNPNIHKGRWTEHEDAILRYSVLEYASVTDDEGGALPIPWNKIAERIPNRTGIQCQARWTEALDPCVRKGKWSPEEDALLRLGVEEFDRCWIKIADIIPGRTQRQCRTRWMQIKYKENRQKRSEIVMSQADERRSSTDDGGSLTSTSTDEDRLSTEFHHPIPALKSTMTNKTATAAAAAAAAVAAAAAASATTYPPNFGVNACVMPSPHW